MRRDEGRPDTVLFPLTRSGVACTLLLAVLAAGCSTSSDADSVTDVSHPEVTQAADHVGQFDEMDGVWDAQDNPDLPAPDAAFYDGMDWGELPQGYDLAPPDDWYSDVATHPWEDWIPEDYQAPAGALELTFAHMGGFDDFSSAGAALGYAVDTDTGWLLLVAMRFQLPTAYEAYELGPDPVATAAGYDVAQSVERLQEEGNLYPLLRSVWTDTNGLRSMASQATVLLVKEDAEAAGGIRLFVASHGALALNRLDGPRDIVTGLGVGFQEVTNLGSGAQLVSEDTLELTPFYLEWNTQP